MHRLPIVVLLSLVVASCGTKPSDPSTNTPSTAASTPSTSQEPSSKPEQHEGDTKPKEQARAQKAIRELKTALGGRLKQAMAEGGPTAAIEVCSKEANALTRQVAKTHNIELGRTSHRVRNPANAPRPWVQTWLDTFATQKASAISPYEAALDGNTVGYIHPIPMGGLCTACHGDPSLISEEVKAAIAQRYPEDKATGFAIGDLRGVFWAEVPRM
ncbi:MAG: DUF3365 domain-containing protein [Myxococcota bacterium]